MHRLRINWNATSNVSCDFFLFNILFFDVESESEIHFPHSELETLDNPEKKKLKFPDYLGFPKPVDENGHWISILQVKILSINIKLNIIIQH